MTSSVTPTLCLGGPLDGQLVDENNGWFFRQVPVGAFFRNEHYRREMFGWGADWMWVYLHEHLSEEQALETLFGPGSRVSAGADPK